MGVLVSNMKKGVQDLIASVVEKGQTWPK